MKKINTFFTFLILFTVFFGVIIYTFAGTYSNDDWWTAFFLKNNFIDNFLDSDQGLVWSHALERFFTHSLPNIIHIHPQQNYFIAIIKGFDFALYIFLLSLFFDVERKKCPNALVVFSNTLLVFFIIFTVDYLILTHINQHFKYLINLIIGASIWYIWINEFLNRDFLSRKKLIRDCIFTVIIVFSGHLVFIPTLVLFTGFLIHLFIKTKEYKKLIKLSFPIYIIYIICISIYMNLPGFTFIWNVRLPSEPILQYSITHFIPFTKEFFLHTFQNKYIYGLLIITIAGFIGMIINRKKIDSEYFMVAICILMANFAFQYSLLTCGTTYYDGKSFWFASYDVTATFLFYLVLNCNIIYGCLYRNLDKNISKAALIILFFIGINIIYPINDVYKNAKDYYKKEFIQREALYKFNKIYRYYSLTGNNIYMPIEYYKQINILAWMYLWEWDFVKNNMTLIYKTDTVKDIEPVYKNISNENELFTKEEIEKINFKKLYNDDFILQMPEPQYEQ